MNNVRSFTQQQLGFSKWKSYDTSLSRLRCINEEFKGIWGDDEGAENETAIFACKFARKQGYEHFIAFANEDGQLVIDDTDNKEPLHGKQIHQNAIFDIDWLCDSFKVITVSGDHTARLVDVGNGSMHIEHMFTGHTRSVKTIAVKNNDPSLFATGSRDGSIRVWDTRTTFSSNLIMTADRTINNSHCRTTPTSSAKRAASVSAANSVTGLVFQDDNTLISCGSGDGLIKVWDLRKTYAGHNPFAKNVIPYCGNTTRNGFSNLLVDPSGMRLYANCLDNTIYCYNIATYNENPIMEYRGHMNSTFYIKSVLSSDGLYLLSGSSDNNAYIWNVNYPNPLVTLEGHTAEVTCVAWKPKNDLALVTCSDDVYHKIWRIGPEMLPDNSEITLRGQARMFNLKNLTKHYLEVNENTPVSAKRGKVESNKRKADEELHSSNSICLNVNADKSAKKNSGRRLFDMTNSLASCSRDEDALAVVLEEDEDNDGCDRRKRPRLMEMVSPEQTFSPTSNLPNFVLDGSAPHLHFSPQKRVDKDWLTKIRVEKRLIRDMQELAAGGPSTPKMRKADERSPRSRPRRRNSNCHSSPQSPILRYFRVTNSSIMKDGQCSPKSSLALPNPTSTSRSEQ